jgi:hypothetical protein
MSTPMAEIFAGRSDWLLHVGNLEPLDILTIHPRDGLTWRQVVDAMGAQGLLKRRPGYRILDHGTKIFIQREQAA